MWNRTIQRAAPLIISSVSRSSVRSVASRNIATLAVVVRASPLVRSRMMTASMIGSSQTFVPSVSNESALFGVRYFAYPPHQQLVMPALSPSMSQGNIVNWKVKEGDKFSAGDVLAEVETDKATMDWEATDDGFIAKILVPAGTHDVKIGTPLAVIVHDKASVGSFGDFKAEASAAQPAAPQAAAAAPQAAAQPAAATAPQPTAAAASQATAPSNDGRVVASPRAKVVGREQNVDLKTVAGSGPNGRVVQADVFAAAQRAPVASASASVVSSAGGDQDYTDLPLSNVRKVIAARLLESKTTIPHYYLTVECAVDELLRVRQELNSRADVKVSVNDFIIKASALALKKVPEVNSSWIGSSIRRYNNVSINVAISTDNGLYSPLVPNVDRLGLADISSSVRTLAEKARENKLHVKDLESGTFTISNLGMFGIKNFAAVINPPQACILATGSVEKRVVVNETKSAASDADFKVASFMSATMSCDHRVVDGAVGAKWLQHFKRYIEDPLTMLL